MECLHVTLAIDKANINYGDVISLDATFAIKDKSPLSNVVVTVQGKSEGEAIWRTLMKATTDFNGHFTKNLLIGKSTSIRAFTEQTWERSEGISNEIAVDVSRLIFVAPPGGMT